MAETALGEALDEFHNFYTVTVCLDPSTELGMFSSDAGNQVSEHPLHLIPHIVEIRRTQVGVVIDDGLKFRPLDLAAPLMEEATLLSIGKSILADETWLSAIWVGANCEARLSIDAFGSSFCLC